MVSVGCGREDRIRITYIYVNFSWIRHMYLRKPCHNGLMLYHLMFIFHTQNTNPSHICTHVKHLYEHSQVSNILSINVRAMGLKQLVLYDELVSNSLGIDLDLKFWC